MNNCETGRGAYAAPLLFLNISQDQYASLVKRAQRLEIELSKVKAQFTLERTVGERSILKARSRATDFGVMVINMDGKVIEWSERAKRVLGGGY